MTPWEELMFRKNTGNTIREQMINNSRYEVEALLEDDPSYKLNVEILGKGFINLRMNNRKLINNTIPRMDIQSALSGDITFNLGDIFLYDNDYWVCIEAFDFHDIFRSGKVEECNYLLRWQNPITFEIIERWCSVRSPYSSGVDEDKIITTGDAKFDITLPYDEETRLLHKDFRFLIDISNNEPIAYKVIRFDGVTNRYASRQEGFLSIKVVECELDTSDRGDLMIANYKEPSPPSPQPEGSCKISFSGDAIGGDAMLRAGGSSKIFRALFWDADDNQITTIAPTWQLDLPSELQNQIVVLSEIDNEIKLQAKNTAFVGSKFALRMTADGVDYGHFEAELEIEIGGMW